MEKVVDNKTEINKNDILNELLKLPRTKEEALKLGSDFYFTNKPCKHGHISKRYIVGNCVQCKLNYSVENQDKIKEQRSKRKDKIRESGRKTDAKRRKEGLSKINHQISSGVSDTINDIKNGKRTQRLWLSRVKFTLDEFINHIEKLFTSGMSWSNYPEWQLDHIKPKIMCESIEETWDLNNLQPLWAKDNLRKFTKHPSKIIHI